MGPACRRVVLDSVMLLMVSRAKSRAMVSLSCSYSTARFVVCTTDRYLESKTFFSPSIPLRPAIDLARENTICFILRQ